MNKKIGHSLENYLDQIDSEQILANLEKFFEKKQTFKRSQLCGYTYTICCPHCERFFEFNLEVEK